ncbi:hypothetical protein BDZ91DRAFT_722500 [Kalaharituber pfeilii]|nr:hypothetical protein BDZ91DRAFT_722500 [Kalaharituber pfeilii]
MDARAVPAPHLACVPLGLFCSSCRLHARKMYVTAAPPLLPQGCSRLCTLLCYAGRQPASPKETLPTAATPCSTASIEYESSLSGHASHF